MWVDLFLYGYLRPTLCADHQDNQESICFIYFFSMVKYIVVLMEFIWSDSAACPFSYWGKSIKVLIHVCKIDTFNNIALREGFSKSTLACLMQTFVILPYSTLFLILPYSLSSEVYYLGLIQKGMICSFSFTNMLSCVSLCDMDSN